jgi:diacylglycerol kinase family enzyme
MYYIIVNPIAGSKYGETRYLPNLLAAFEEQGLNCTPLVTTKVKDAHEFAKEICENNTDCEGIIGVGGDGTMQEIVSGMADSYPHGSKIPIPLGLYPGGSGNDFVMGLEGGKSAIKKKYKKDKNAGAKTFAEKIARKKFRAVDLISANEKVYLVAGNIGIDARIVNNAIALKPKYNGQAYLAAAYKSIMQHKNIPMEITINGETISKEFTLIAVCNNSSYGGGLYIAPPAKFDDGEITLCMVDGMNRAKLGLLFPSILVKKHVHLKAIKFINCTELKVKLPAETLCLDGNLFPVEGEIYFKILPGVLDVFI